MNILPIQPISPVQSLTAQPVGSSASAQGTQSSSFSSFLNQALNQVNSLASSSEQQGINLASGSAPDIASVMVSATQAQIAVDLAVQVRDRVIQAYNQVMNMQV